MDAADLYVALFGDTPPPKPAVSAEECERQRIEAHEAEVGNLDLIGSNVHNRAAAVWKYEVEQRADPECCVNWEWRQTPEHAWPAKPWSELALGGAPNFAQPAHAPSTGTTSDTTSGKSPEPTTTPFHVP
ncbi:hypothetical protein QTI66_32285 [Variovorax sp. J22R133]|uniref:hypothetical protein n=1 Tax=Variovorax brevis TaxID=3053503 RepID=UPI002578C9D0|nr:hypothetical protein [Variovorax sp. J22R133]MDM0116812.1 hypothetical protein [Variovorax sp. J22R133]